MKNDLKFDVSKENTLLPFLLTCFKGKSRNYVKGILKRGQIQIDGTVCTNYAHPLAIGQKVTVLKTAPIIYDLGFPIIYEDEDLIVINKPAGMLAIATDKEHENTAYYKVNEYMKTQDSHGRVFIVHRLDRETSGIMLLAKNERIKHALQENWNDNVIKRGYIALVEGKVPTAEGTIKSWLKQTTTFLVYSSRTDGDGKLAITNYKTLQTSDQYSLLDISLETGRKNQIRVHMNDMGHPVAGDKKYGAATNPLGRLGLHASILTIKHPYSDSIMNFEAITPSGFLKFF